tara:strand:+ start:339 stop:470 length:132 start_codon:yes stop_codon:yes gene_type:complete
MVVPLNSYSINNDTLNWANPKGSHPIKQIHIFYSLHYHMEYNE